MTDVDIARLWFNTALFSCDRTTEIDNRYICYQRPIVQQVNYNPGKGMSVSSITLDRDDSLMSVELSQTVQNLQMNPSI